MSVNKVNPDGSLTRIAGGTLYADMPVGTIVPYGGSNAPSGFLICDGSAISRTAYAELFAAIGMAFGSGDGSTTFNLPDLRETVPVGTGTRASGVAAHDTYEVGTFKDDQLQAHKHNVSMTHSNTIAAMDASSNSNWGGVKYVTNADGSTSQLYAESISSGRGGTTTHGKQLGVNYIIKAKQVGVPQDILDSIDYMLADVTDVIPSNASADNQLVTKNDITIHTKTMTDVITNSNSNVNLGIPMSNTVLSALVTDEYPLLRAIAWYDPSSHVWFAHVTDTLGDIQPDAPVSLVVRYI